MACFLKFQDGLGGVENWTIMPLFHGVIICCLLSSLNACILHFNEGKGRDHTFAPQSKDSQFHSMILVVCVDTFNCPYG